MFPKSHPLALYPSGFHEKEDFTFFDIETLGLFNRPIILFGVAQISGNQILINQYFLRDIMEESAALMGFLSQINKNSVFMTFNGRTFDIPYTRAGKSIIITTPTASGKTLAFNIPIFERLTHKGIIK